MSDCPTTTNRLYTAGREGILTGTIAWLTSEIKGIILPAGYTFDDADVNLSDIIGKGITPIVQSPQLTNPVGTGGFAISDAITFTALTSTEVATQLILAATVATEQQLIAYLDDIDGWPFVPTGGDYTINPSGPNNSWFSL